MRRARRLLQRPLVALVALALTALLVGWRMVTPKAAGAALPQTAAAGFSFSPQSAAFYGEEPDQALATLLTRLEPDLVRLPVYWESAAPDPTHLDFGEADRMIAVVEAYNAAHPGHRVRFVLVVGLRNLGYPELHAPAWALSSGSGPAGLLAMPGYQSYLKAAVQRYATQPDLAAWQLENEPLDDVAGPGRPSDAIPAAALAAELRLVRQLDPRHQVVVTSFNSSTVQLDETQTSPLAAILAHLPGPKPAGHMPQVLKLGDVVGLDAYVVTPSTPLSQVGALERIDWKRQTLAYWGRQAQAHSKPLWVTEMQAAPWLGQPGFTPQDLLDSALAYADHGPRVVLLWGVEYWLRSTRWLDAGSQALQILRDGGQGLPA